MQIEAKQEISVEDLQICHDTLSKIVDVDSLDREGLVLLSRILSTWNRGLPSPFIRIGIKDRIDRLKSDDKACLLSVSMVITRYYSCCFPFVSW